MAANIFRLRVYYPAFSKEPAAGRAVRAAAGRQRNIFMRQIAKVIRRASPKRTGALRRAIRYRSIQNRYGLAVSRLSTRKFYSSFVDDRTKWWTEATEEKDIINLVTPLLAQWESTLRIEIEKAAARILKRAESDQVKVRFGR